MTILYHAGLFLLSILIIWTMSGRLVEATDRVARRYHKPGFAVAFFVLGILTSISEISVAFNSSLANVPQVSAGNLVGASIVIFLLIVPLLAILGGRIELDHVLSKHNLMLCLLIIGLPAFFLSDGAVEPREAWITLALYATIIYRLHKREPLEETIEEAVQATGAELINKRRATALDAGYIIMGAVLIFFAGKMLVTESVYFTDLIGVPASLAGLLILSLGTNIPELVIGIRSVLRRHSEIAFGNYVGSAVTNSLTFSLLGIAHPHFAVESLEFIYSAALLLPCLALFLWFSHSNNDVSRNEGLFLLGGYILFVALQVTSLG